MPVINAAGPDSVTASVGHPGETYNAAPPNPHVAHPPHTNDGRRSHFTEATTDSPPESPTSSGSDFEPSARRGSNASDMLDHGPGVDGNGRPLPIPLSHRERRMSKEWDAACTPPSRFQKLQGSIMATPASRDGHVPKNKKHGLKEKMKHLAHKDK